MAVVVKHTAVVFLGALLGAMLRITTEWGFSWGLGMAPAYGLLVVNALGCGAFGYCNVVLTQQGLRLFWLTGCWGAYTSFSALSLVYVLWLPIKQPLLWLIYGVITVLSWGLLFALGQQLGQWKKRG